MKRNKGIKKIIYITSLIIINLNIFAKATNMQKFKDINITKTENIKKENAKNTPIQFNEKQEALKSSGQIKINNMGEILQELRNNKKYEKLKQLDEINKKNHNNFQKPENKIIEKKIPYKSILKNSLKSTYYDSQQFDLFETNNSTKHKNVTYEPNKIIEKKIIFKNKVSPSLETTTSSTQNFKPLIKCCPTNYENVKYKNLKNSSNNSTEQKKVRYVTFNPNKYTMCNNNNLENFNNNKPIELIPKKVEVYGEIQNKKIHNLRKSKIIRPISIKECFVSCEPETKKHVLKNIEDKKTKQLEKTFNDLFKKLNNQCCAAKQP